MVEGQKLSFYKKCGVLCIFFQQQFNHSAHHDSSLYYLKKILKTFCLLFPGVVHKDDCPVQSFVPLWLYVSGSAFAFMIIIFLLRSCIKRMKTTPPPEEQNPSAVYSCFNFLISLFTLAWFVAGECQNVFILKSVISEVKIVGAKRFNKLTVVATQIRDKSVWF